MARLPLFLSPTSLDLAWGRPRENLRRIQAAVDAGLRAHPKVPPEARLFLFPELALTGFVTEAPPSFRLEPPAPVLASLRRFARSRRVAIAAGFPERNPADRRRPFNTLAVFGSDGEVAGSYRKIHRFTWGKNPETEAYSAGDAGSVFVHRGWKVGLAVCFDIRFSGLFHQYARAGTDLVLVAACWIGGPHKTYQFKTLNAGHAIHMQSYLAAVNRSGRDPFFEYDGAEYLFSPFGEDLSRGRPVELKASELEAARKLVVRPSDRASYRVVETGKRPVR